MQFPSYTAQKVKPSGCEDKHSSGTLKHGYFYAGVYDGHNGSKAAESSADLMPKLIEQYLSERSLVSTLKLAFTAVDARVPDASGCTATTSIMNQNYVCVAHVGDSRAVLCRANHAIDITEDHRLDYKPEKERLQRSELRLNKPLIGGSRVQGLMLTRSIGDHDLTSEISPYPAIHEFRLTADDQFIIIASDGLWDVCSSAEAIKYVHKHHLQSAEDISQHLVEHAMHSYQRRAMRLDDITCTVIYLHEEIKKRNRLSWIFRNER